MQGNPSDSWGFMVDFHSRRLSWPSVFLAKFSGRHRVFQFFVRVYNWISDILDHSLHET